MATDFLTNFLATILHEQGVENHLQVAKRAAEDLQKAKVIDRRAVLRAQIQSDPCVNYKEVARKYHVPVSFVYQAWNTRNKTSLAIAE